jgi:rRNA maturation protein Nop10
MAHKPVCNEPHYDVEEMCPKCGNYIAVQVDFAEPHLETVCPVCGYRMMICSMCDGNCDWTEKYGCHKDRRHCA